MIQNIGLYAMDGEREILFAVSQAQVPEDVYKRQAGGRREKTWEPGWIT